MDCQSSHGQSGQVTHDQNWLVIASLAGLESVDEQARSGQPCRASQFSPVLANKVLQGLQRKYQPARVSQGQPGLGYS